MILLEDKTMKKILYLLSTIILAVTSMTGCGSKQTDAEAPIIGPVVLDEYMPRTDGFVDAEIADVEAQALYADMMTPAEEPEPEIVEIISFDLIALCAYTEAGNQPEEGIRAVVDVIRNRVEHPAYPNTAEEVILQPNQFAIANHTVPEEFKQIVFDEWITDKPVLSAGYVYFDTKPHIYGKNYILIGSHWFGEYK